MLQFHDIGITNCPYTKTWIPSRVLGRFVWILGILKVSFSGGNIISQSFSFFIKGCCDLKRSIIEVTLTSSKIVKMQSLDVFSNQEVSLSHF